PCSRRGVVVRSSHGFFCRAEDGIRAFHVTGVQTCALPIFFADGGLVPTDRFIATRVEAELAFVMKHRLAGPNCTLFDVPNATDRSEERRVGDECGTRWCHEPWNKQRRGAEPTTAAHGERHI